MRILADENIPYVREAFSSLGDVETVAGRGMDPGLVRDADLLLVRSITKVNAALLAESSVRFVGTATIGEDHIDKEYLSKRGIAFASAPGCNANSVGQYITAALLELAAQFALDLGRMTLGIVGVGNVGSNVVAKATVLGMTCVLNDPPLQRKTGDPKYRSIEKALACDVLTLHVPLTKAGPDATHHLAGDGFVRKMKPGAILVNTSRGPVAEGAALKRALADGHLRACVLDVWEGEPDVDMGLLEQVFIGTPHIAGYSLDGKVNGTRMIYEAACRFLEMTPTWDPAPLLPAPDCPRVDVDATAPDSLRTAVRSVYDIMWDDAAMRRLLTLSPEERPKEFDRLRKEYPRRREFFNTQASVTPANPGLEGQLEGLGFRVV